MVPEMLELLLPVPRVHVQVDMPSRKDVQEERGETTCIQSRCSLGAAAVVQEGLCQITKKIAWIWGEQLGLLPELKTP